MFLHNGDYGFEKLDQMTLRLFLLCCGIYVSLGAVCALESKNEELALSHCAVFAELSPSSQIECPPPPSVSSTPSTVEKSAWWSPLPRLSEGFAQWLGKPEVELESDPGLKYWAKWWLTIKIRQNFFSSAVGLNQKIPMPQDERVQLVPWTTLGIPLKKFYTTRSIPSPERSIKKSFGALLVHYIAKFFPLESPGLPQIPEDLEDLMTLSYPAEFRQLFPPPQCPAQILDHTNDLIGALALAGPFAGYIQKSKDVDDLYEIDLQVYQPYPVKPGLARLGGKALLIYDQELKRMKTVSIQYTVDAEGESWKEEAVSLGGSAIECEGRSKWERAQKTFLATLQTDITVVRHLLRAHLMIAGTFCAVNNSILPEKHPLRRLMHPHQFMTLSTNNLQLKLLLGQPESLVPVLYSYDLSTFQRILSDLESSSPETSVFQLKMMDGVESFEDRGMKRTPFPYPYRENATRLWKIIERYVGNYIDFYYPDSNPIQKDVKVREWYQGLDTYIPNGIGNYVPVPDTKNGPSKEHVTKLITLFIYTASVEHEQVGNITFNYLMWNQHIPFQVRLDGKRNSIALHQAGLGAQLVTNAPSPKLTDDYRYVMLHQEGRACLKDFVKELRDYQRELDDEGIHPYTLCPTKLECSIAS